MGEQAKKYHPDRVPLEQREEAKVRFQLLAEAFAVLGSGESDLGGSELKPDSLG